MLLDFIITIYIMSKRGDRVQLYIWNYFSYFLVPALLITTYFVQPLTQGSPSCSLLLNPIAPLLILAPKIISNGNSFGHFEPIKKYLLPVNYTCFIIELMALGLAITCICINY